MGAPFSSCPYRTGGAAAVWVSWFAASRAEAAAREMNSSPGESLSAASRWAPADCRATRTASRRRNPPDDIHHVLTGYDTCRLPKLDRDGGRGDDAERALAATSLVLAVLGAARAALRTHTDLALENVALRQQLALLRHRSKRPWFGGLDRPFWVWLSRRWAGWRDALHVVRPETVIRWHRQGFRAFWTWKSRSGRTGRPSVGSEVAKLVRTARLMPRRPKSPSQTWRTFLQNHVLDLVSVDFFVVPTATFRLLLRDRDGIYGDEFRRRVKGVGIAEILAAPRSPWQNAFVERVIGS